jgi:hypothetical protein
MPGEFIFISISPGEHLERPFFEYLLDFTS